MAGASFNVEQFDKLIQEHGYDVIWYPSIACECIEDNQPNFHCKLCLGKGYRYLPGRYIKVISTSLTGGQELKIQGLSEKGAAYITPQRGVIMGYHDKIEFYEIKAKYTQSVKVIKNKTTRTLRPIDKLSFVLQENRVYQEGIDFVITKDKHRLKWINDNKPRDKSKVSILYLTKPEYAVIDMVHELRSVKQNKGTKTPYTVDMPRQYQIKRLDFIYGQSVNALKDEENTEKSKLLNEDFNYE